MYMYYHSKHNILCTPRCTCTTIANTIYCVHLYVHVLPQQTQYIVYTYMYMYYHSKHNILCTPRCTCTTTANTIYCVHLDVHVLP